MKIRVEVFENIRQYKRGMCMLSYVMEHDEQDQRRVLGEQCRNAFEGGQVVVTHPEPK